MMASFWIEVTDSDLILHNKYGLYSKKELESQLYEGHLTLRELAEIYDLKKYQIVHVLKTLGIFYRNSLNDTRIISPEITSDMHQMMIGTLAGDAYMKEPKCYQLTHGINQVEYLYHCANVLAPFIATVGYGESKTGKSFFLWTHRHSIFIPYFNRFYSHGKTKKFFTEESLHDLDARGLAYWYMDDGKYKDYGAYLCVGNISVQEGSVLVGLLKRLFNIEALFQNQDSVKGYYNIYIKSESQSHFFSLIEPYVLTSMRYKKEGKPPPNIFLDKDSVANFHRALCVKADRALYFSGIDGVQEQVGVAGFKKDYMENIRQKMVKKEQVSYTAFRALPSESDLIKLLLEGKTDQHIASCFKVSRARISKMRNTLGIPDKRTIARTQL